MHSKKEVLNMHHMEITIPFSLKLSLDLLSLYPLGLSVLNTF